ncbi:MAG TPA: adenylate/guanylate cyclase domain-containing protein [Burkholderiales bacterium]|nr:adenylate/guanylate cyclase domain-containing protein [Burkholderiales bacterium]
MTAAPQQLAILFADVSGSTGLYEKLGDQAALAAIESVLSELRKSVALQRGRIVKTIGDEVMAVLSTADAAMQAACDMQNRVAAVPPLREMRLAIRVGFHFGQTIEEGGDFFGDAVNTAARMAGLAKAGQIITSGPTVEAMSELLRASTRDLDAMVVKGKREEIRIFEVIWRDSGDLTTLAGAEAPAPAGEHTLRLIYRGESLTLGPERRAASLGRDTGNDLVIADKMASRVHCRIEYRRGEFFLMDQSTNGTYVKVEGDAEIVLKREQALLRGQGIISLGHSAAAADGETVTFMTARSSTAAARPDS